MIANTTTTPHFDSCGSCANLGKPECDIRQAAITPQVFDHDVVVENHEEHDHSGKIERLEIIRIAFVALCALLVWVEAWEPLSHISIIGVMGLAVGGWPIFKEAFDNLIAKRMTMELSMTIAIVAAAAISEYFTSLVITLFVLVAEILEGLTVERGRTAIRELVEFLPKTVSVRDENGEISEIRVECLTIGDLALVNPGGRIPVDGTVVAGQSFVNQARITGESMPLEKVSGDFVYAGSINDSGVLEIRTERLSRDTSYGKIIEAVEQAEQSRAPVQRVADQLAGYLVYFAIGAAVLTYILTRDMRSTISVIIVAGACGVAAGTPLAILGGIGRAAREGSIIKGGLSLEQLGKADTVAFDKTGTLTYGEPEIRALLPAPGVDPMDLLDAAASAEIRSEHPLGKTIIDKAIALQRSVQEPQSFSYVPGLGITVSLNDAVILAGNRSLMQANNIVVSEGFLAAYPEASEVYIARDGVFLGAIAIADKLRTEAKSAIAQIHALGMRTLLLTGDTQSVAETVAEQLGITELASNLMPDDKSLYIRKLVGEGRKVIMVGDGVNDAPALMEASVGIAMGSGTDVARESADIVLLGNDLKTLVETLIIARRVKGIIWANFAGTIGVDAIGIALAAFGMLSPLGAAFIHVSSELVFILNSARLLPASNVRNTKPQ